MAQRAVRSTLSGAKSIPSGGGVGNGEWSRNHPAARAGKLAALVVGTVKALALNGIFLHIPQGKQMSQIGRGQCQEVVR